MKQLLQEYFELCPEGRCPVDRLTESEKRDISNGGVYLVGVCQRAGVKNGNGRVYKRETLQREIERYQKAINERRSMGELDHPDDSVINLRNVSHYITKLWWDNDNVMGKIKVLSTPSGLILKELVKEGVKLGISSRGMGSVRESNGQTIVEDDFQLICFDMVSEPSTPGAYMAPERERRNAFEGLSLQEGVEADKVNSLIQEIIR